MSASKWLFLAAGAWVVAAIIGFVVDNGPSGEYLYLVFALTFFASGLALRR